MEANIMSEFDNENKRGYLKEEFRFFHLKEQKTDSFSLHYHTFNKIVIFIKGDVTYLIEGKHYKLKPWDIILVSKNQIHMPIINPTKTYERFILWINDEFLQKDTSESFDLLSCFHMTSNNNHLLRLTNNNLELIKYRIYALKDSMTDNYLGHYTIKKCLFLQLIVVINRFFIGNGKIDNTVDVVYDKRIESLLKYINNNLESDLSIDTLSKIVFLNKYYLMHLFKEQIGYPIHKYIQEKRLIKSCILIKQGILLSQVCLDCGFGDYSTFVRTFKKKYGLPPKDYLKSINQWL
jgi:AraC-like DNA-binding protein